MNIEITDLDGDIGSDWDLYVGGEEESEQK
jgi:hypothetical protein